MAAQLQELAGRQHGVVAYGQLLGLGITRHQIAGLRRRGWLLPLHRGVFAVGHGNVGIEGRWMAAVLAGGEGAVLSHTAAAGLWGVGPRGPHAHVTTRSPRRHRPGITFHTSLLPSDEVTRHHGIPVTTPHRTLFDLASITRREAVERAINEADYRRLPDTLGLPQLLRRHPRAIGAATIRAIVLGGAIPDMRSPLEEEFTAWLRDRGLRLPELNVPLEVAPGHIIRVDCAWRDARLIVELDGGQAHMTRKRFHGDRLRDRRLHRLGWDVWRVTGDHLDDELAEQLGERLGPPAVAHGALG